MSKKQLKVVLTVAPAGAGKSTWAQKFISENEKYVRVNRDDFRFMLKNAPVTDYKVEEMISTLSNNAIMTALNAGFNVIVDNTHLKAKYINQVKELVKYKADVEYMIFDVPLETIIAQDSTREKKVGGDVITKMYSDFIELKNTFDFSIQKKQHKIYDGKIKESTLPKAIIIDLDSTLFHNNNKRGIYDWQNCHLDDIDEYIKEFIEIYKSKNYKILLVSARDGAAANSTQEALNKHGIDFDFLFLKDVNDSRKDTIVKREIFELEIKNKFEVVLALDDRPNIVKMWRDLGIKAFQVIDND